MIDQEQYIVKVIFKFLYCMSYTFSVGHSGNLDGVPNIKRRVNKPS